MKLFIILRIIPPNVLLKQKIKKITILLFSLLIFTQQQYSYSFVRNSPSFSEFNLLKNNKPSGLTSQATFKEDWMFNKFTISKLRKRNLLTQISFVTVLKTSYCTGESGSIEFETTGIFNTSNRFSVQMSSYNGSFSSPTVIGFIYSSTTGTVNVSFKIPSNLPIGNSYRMRIVASSPSTNSGSSNVFQLTTLAIPSLAVSSQVICPGGSANLVATCTAGTVNWYDAQEDGNVITGLTVSPSVSTDYFAACETGGVCSSARVRQIVIVNRPEVLIPPYASSCVNSDLELAVVTEETTLNYSWTGPSGFTSTLQNPIIPNLTAPKEGVYSVTITNAGNCLVTGTTSVNIGTVLQNLNVFGDVSVCFSDSINLMASSSVPNGMIYSWTGPNSFTSNGQNLKRVASTFNSDGSINYNNGLYALTANNATTGCTGNTAIDILIAERPSIPLVLPTVSICEGTNYAFNLAISGANFKNYFWTGPNGFSASTIAVCDSSFICNNVVSTISNFSSSNVGLYTLRATFIDANNISCQVKSVKTISLKPSPDIAITTNSAVCLGNALLFNTTYNPSTIGITSFSWTGPNNFTSNIQNPTISTTSVTATGIYKLTAVGVNSCVATATTFANIVESVPPIVVPTAGVVLSNSITLTATGCQGTLNWYKSADNQAVTMPVSPIVATSYYAKCNVSNCISSKSGDILVSIKPAIAISTKTGNWEDKATWDILRVPLPIDSVIIRPSHLITINSQAYAKWLSWSGFGNLIFASPSSKLNLFGTPAPPIVVNPPVLSSNPATVYESISVTFTVTGTGVISWFKNGIDLNITGSTYTVNNPAKDDVYTAKRTLSGVTSSVSNAITVLITSSVSPPVLSSSVATVYEGISVTFTATGASGTVFWYKNGIALNVTGSTYTVTNPIKDDVYTAKILVGSVLSNDSNTITVVALPPPPSSNVITTVPNKPPYYFSDGHPPSYYDGNLNLPAIFTNQPRYDPVNDLVWLKNDKIKIGINLKRGGQIAWASLLNATTNLVYNGYDGGFQITLDAYQKKDGYSQGGEVAGSGNPGMPTSYNVTHGGDYLNNSVSLIDYHSVPNGYYVKLRPIHYPLNAKFSQTYIEVTYTIIGRSVKIDYRYTSFRTDGQYVGGGFDGAGAPACFIVNTLNKYKTFNGSSPWAFLPTQGGNLPIANLGQNIAESHSTEHWGMVYDAQNPNSGIGIYNNTNNTSTTYFVFKQLEVYPGNGPGTEFNNGFTFFQPFIDFNIADRGNYVKDLTAYMMIGSEYEIRSEVYKFSGHESNIPRF